MSLSPDIYSVLMDIKKTRTESARVSRNRRSIVPAAARPR